MSYGEWQPYVSVAQRRARAAREMKKLRSRGMDVEPIEIQGRKIAHTFWGDAWCKHLERFSDFANRLPRGRTYVRNGSVCHLAIKQGKVEAIVSGSELYKVTIDIAPLSSARWKHVRKQCAGQIGSMLELLQGHLSSQVMGVVTNPAKGLFPQPGDIKLHCDCPDWADMCKHVAAVLYGVGTRLDKKPELLFVLRKVDHEALIPAELDMRTATTGQGKRRRLANQDLSNMFGIDIEDTAPPAKKENHSAENRMPCKQRKIDQQEYDVRKQKIQDRQCNSDFKKTALQAYRRRGRPVTQTVWNDAFPIRRPAWRQPTDGRKLGIQTWQTQTPGSHLEDAHPGMVTATI